MAPEAMVAAVAANMIWNSSMAQVLASAWLSINWFSPNQPVLLVPNISPKPTPQNTSVPTHRSM